MSSPENERVERTEDPCPSLESIFSGIRHEIGNPVNSIKITASVLKENLDKFPKEKIVKYTDRVLMEVERIEELLRNLKNFTLYDTLLIKEVDVQDFIRKSLAQVDVWLREKERQITIRSHIEPGTGLLYTDRRALNRVFLNIMENASDAVAEIENPVIIVDVRRVNDKIHIAVTDNGHGVPGGYHEDIFKLFFSTRPRRLGMGLSIARRIVSKMNGSIQVRGGGDAGTAVIIQIPVGESHEPR